MSLALQIAPQVGVVAACEALGVPRATLYRRLWPKDRAPRPRSLRALSTDEQQAILAVLHDPRFVDASPAEVGVER